VAGELETFLAVQQDNERQVQGFIEKEFRSFLDCGVLAGASSGSLATPAGWTASPCIRPPRVSDENALAQRHDARHHERW